MDLFNFVLAVALVLPVVLITILLFYSAYKASFLLADLTRLYWKKFYDWQQKVLGKK
jgi:hypothetical protein